MEEETISKNMREVEIRKNRSRDKGVLAGQTQMERFTFQADPMSFCELSITFDCICNSIQNVIGKDPRVRRRLFESANATQ